MTFICLKYDGFVMLVAFTEKSALSRVYGKSLSKVILIFVFRVGFADGGTSCMPALVVAIVAKDRLLLTVWLFITIDNPYDCPAEALTSNAEVRQTREVELDSCGIHLVSWVSVNLISIVLVSMFHGNCVPEIVKLSPPSKLSWVVGWTEETVQVIVVSVKFTLLLTKP
jgi:hypothetical protein